MNEIKRWQHIDRLGQLGAEYPDLDECESDADAWGNGVVENTYTFSGSEIIRPAPAPEVKPETETVFRVVKIGREPYITAWLKGGPWPTRDAAKARRDELLAAGHITGRWAIEGHEVEIDDDSEEASA